MRPLGQLGACSATEARPVRGCSQSAGGLRAPRLPSAPSTMAARFYGLSWQIQVGFSEKLGTGPCVCAGHDFCKARLILACWFLLFLSFFFIFFPWTSSSHGLRGGLDLGGSNSLLTHTQASSDVPQNELKSPRQHCAEPFAELPVAPARHPVGCRHQ